MVTKTYVRFHSLSSHQKEKSREREKRFSNYTYYFGRTITDLLFNLYYGFRYASASNLVFFSQWFNMIDLDFNSLLRNREFLQQVVSEPLMLNHWE